MYWTTICIGCMHPIHMGVLPKTYICIGYIYWVRTWSGDVRWVGHILPGNIFGVTEVERMNLWRSEKRAYFDLISPRNIVTTGNVHREYQESSMQYSGMWLQTVTNV